MLTIVLATYAVRLADGSIDTDATTTKFQGDLDKYIAERETELETISAAVHSVFDKHLGVRINMPALTSLSLQELNVQPANYKALSDRVQEFVRSAAGDRETGATFGIGKGKGGGVCRWEDVPVPAAPAPAAPAA